MSNSSIRKLLILGALIVAGIIAMQAYWAVQNWKLKDLEFNQQVHISLRNVAKKLADYNNSKLPKQNLIQKRSSNYYAVNINDEIDANILEDFLVREFESQSLNTDFEYAVYDCSSDDMVYGNYCDIGEREPTNINEGVLPKFQGLEYYFVVKFPSKTSYIVRSIWQSILFSAVTFLALGFFIYATVIILRQKRLSEMQKEFINNMTHEFKTPISSMKIAADVLANDRRINQDERLNKYVEIIKKQNIRLNKQVEKVLDIARIEKDALKLNFEPIELGQLLEEIIEGFKIKATELGGKLTYIGPNQELTISADRLHLSNVIYNILDNATKYYNNQLKIEIVLENNGSPSIEIKDHGIGIKEEHIKNLFNKFYRVPTGNVHNVKGFGLGLYYVKNICDAHQWDIQVSSKEGLFTTFKINFKK